MATRCRSSCTSMFSKRGIRGRRLYIDTQHRGEHEPHAPSWRGSKLRGEGGLAVAGKHDVSVYVCVSGGPCVCVLVLSVIPQCSVIFTLSLYRYPLSLLQRDPYLPRVPTESQPCSDRDRHDEIDRGWRDDDSRRAGCLVYPSILQQQWGARQCWGATGRGSHWTWEDGHDTHPVVARKERRPTSHTRLGLAAPR